MNPRRWTLPDDVVTPEPKQESIGVITKGLLLSCGFWTTIGFLAGCVLAGFSMGIFITTKLFLLLL